jgi:hypothetical protein
MAYGSVAGISALVPVIGGLDGSSIPTAIQAQTWLIDASAIIDRHVATAGYTVPVPNTAQLWTELSALANLYAAALSLQARGIDTVTGEAETPSQVMLERFYTQLTDIAKSNLAGLGATVTPVTGTSSRRRLRTVQVRRIDGYSENALGDEWDQ